MPSALLINGEVTNMSLLEITNLSYSYGDNMIYKNAGLSLYKGDHMGIVGHNGVGKSTLIKLCSGELLPDSGSVGQKGVGGTLGPVRQNRQGLHGFRVYEIRL